MKARIKAISILFVIFLAGIIIWIFSPLMIPIPSPNEIMEVQQGSTVSFQSTRDALEISKIEPECRKAQRDDLICKVHREQIKTEIVKIKYGLGNPKPEREEAEATSFPQR